MTKTNTNYNASDIEKKQFTTDTGKMLKNVVSNIYANKETFIREVISNAHDACAKELIRTIKDGKYQSKINVILDAKQKTLTFSDNGIGMSRKDLEDYIGKLGSSSTDKFKKDNQNSGNMIGQFGVGFYSVFMVSDHVTVLTKKEGEAGAQWISKGNGEYTIANIDKKEIGTKIIITLKEGEFLESLRVKNVITKYFAYSETSIYFTEVKDDKESEPVKMNEEFSILKTAKEEITDEQYNKFYSSTFYDYLPPLKVVNIVKELPTMTLKIILFIPSNQPFDLNAEKTGGNIKLYVNDTFISSSNELAFTNRSFRWVKGIISCDDITLNMSRENMQDNDHNTKLIRKTIDRIIINEINKMRKDDKDKYDKVVTKFNSILKEGLCEPGYNQELLEIISFNVLDLKGDVDSTQTLKECATEAKEEIYYLFAAAKSLEDLKKDNAHHINRFKSIKEKGDKKIILLFDSVDLFWTRFITEYEGKKLVSINSVESDANEANNKNDSEEDKKLNEELVDFVKKGLQEYVDKVSINKSNTYPIQLQGNSTSDNIMNKMTGNKQEVKNNIEININHPMIKKLNLKTSSADESKSALFVAYNLALVLDGQQLIHRTDFANQILNNLK